MLLTTLLFLPSILCQLIVDNEPGSYKVATKKGTIQFSVRRDGEYHKFRMQAPAGSGYVAVGVGKNMEEADVYVGWFDGTKLNVSYGKASGFKKPDMIAANDPRVGDKFIYQPEASKMVGGVRYFEFWRKLEVPSGPIDLIWAMNYKDPENNDGLPDLMYHKQKGEFQINLNALTD